MWPSHYFRPQGATAMAKAAKIWYEIKLHPFEFQNSSTGFLFSFFIYQLQFFQLAQLFKGRQVLFELFSLKVKREKEKFVVGCFRPLILVSHWDVSCFKGVTWWQEELYVKTSVVHVPSSFLMFPLLSPPCRLLKLHNKSEGKPRMSFTALFMINIDYWNASPSKIRFWGDKQKVLWHVMAFSGVVNCAFPRIVIYRWIALSTELLNNWDYDGKVISIVFVAHGVNS